MKEVLQKITQNTALEAKWLHTLSLLEHIGARKISKSMGKNHPDEFVLKHLADETRHAHAFKRLSCQLAGCEIKEYLCGPEAVQYFQTLDKTLSEWIHKNAPQNPTLASYLLVTTLIEKRAMKIYPLYRSTTQNQFIKDELATIILEESDHKPGIENRAFEYLQKCGANFELLQTIEDNLFNTFTVTLKNTLQ